MSEGESRFLDTNIWLYAFISSQDQAKSEKARQLIQEHREGIVVSVQVISEVCANLIRKAAYPEAEIRALIQSFYTDYSVVELDRPILIRASELRESYSLSFWDGTIVAAALHRSVPLLLSEDFQDGLVLEGCTRIVNPFRDEG